MNERQRRDEATEARMARYLEGDLPPQEHAALEEEILEDEGRSEELYSQVLLRDALDGRLGAAAGGVARRSPAPRSARRALLALVAALAVAAVVIPILRQGETPEPVLRGGSGRLELIGATTVPNGTLLVWHPDRGATHYRVELLDASGAVTARFVTADTTFTIDAAAGTDATRWRVVGLDESGNSLPAPATLPLISP